MSRRIWKEGADPHRTHRASRHEVVSRLADANCGRRSALFWRRAKRNTIPPNSSKGRLMRFQVMRLSAAALAMSVLLVGAASAQQTPKAGAPAVPAAPAQRRRQRLPSKLDLVSPEPIWAKLCAKDNSACATMRDFRPLPISPPRFLSMSWSSRERKSTGATSMHLQVPIGVASEARTLASSSTRASPSRQSTTCVGRALATPPRISLAKTLRGAQESADNDCHGSLSRPRRAIGSRAVV